MAISGSILADPLACLVIKIEFALGSTFAFPTHQAIIGWSAGAKEPSASQRSAVLIAPPSFHPWLTATNLSLGMSRSSSLSRIRSEEHTSELQSRGHLVCRLLLEKKQH